MQVLKEEIRRRILQAAREEFTARGFMQVSIRDIAGKAEVSKSNLARYFRSKDDLFEKVVEPTLQAARQGFGRLEEANAGKSVQGYTMNAQEQVMGAFAAFISSHKEDLRLLLYASEGSSLAGFREEVTDSLARVLSGWVDEAVPKAKLPPLFLSSVANFYIGAMERMLMAKAGWEDAAACFPVFLRFVYGGWKTVLDFSGGMPV